MSLRARAREWLSGVLALLIAAAVAQGLLGLGEWSGVVDLLVTIVTVLVLGSLLAWVLAR